MTEQQQNYIGRQEGKPGREPSPEIEPCQNLHLDFQPPELWENILCGSAGKQSACNVGDPGLIPVQKILWRRARLPTPVFLGLSCGSAGKESACNAGDPGWIPGSGRSAGEGIGYPLLYSWASLVAQLVKNLPVMRETSVLSLGWEDPLNKGKATHSSILD